MVGIDSPYHAGRLAVRAASLVGHRGLGVEVLVRMVASTGYPANLFLSQRAPEQALAGLFRKLKGYLFFGAAFVVFDTGFFRSRRVAESAALNG